jgi:hypothetical protein
LSVRQVCRWNGLIFKSSRFVARKSSTLGSQAALTGPKSHPKWRGASHLTILHGRLDPPSRFPVPKLAGFENQTIPLPELSDARRIKTSGHEPAIVAGLRLHLAAGRVRRLLVETPQRHVARIQNFMAQWPHYEMERHSRLVGAAKLFFKLRSGSERGFADSV